MAYWLLKTEPETFSWDDQLKRGAKGEPWTGVRNFKARGYMKVMKKAYPDPTNEKGVFKAVDVKAVKPVPKPVTLAAVKAEPKLKEMALVKYSRLSVQPVTAQEWKLVCKMAGLKE